MSDDSDDADDGDDGDEPSSDGTSEILVSLSDSPPSGRGSGRGSCGVGTSGGSCCGTSPIGPRLWSGIGNIAGFMTEGALILRRLDSCC